MKKYEDEGGSFLGAVLEGDALRLAATALDFVSHRPDLKRPDDNQMKINGRATTNARTQRAISAASRYLTISRDASLARTIGFGAAVPVLAPLVPPVGAVGVSEFDIGPQVYFRCGRVIFVKTRKIATKH